MAVSVQQLPSPPAWALQAVLTLLVAPAGPSAAWELPAGTISKARYWSRAWEAASDVNHAISARDGALHLLCRAYLACCICLPDLLTALHFRAVGERKIIV